MPDRIIPRLYDLRLPSNDFKVNSGFAHKFAKLHSDDWSIAEDHWERVVARVLKTDAVQPRASKHQAVQQAVAAAVTLLDRSSLHDRCPFCPFAETNNTTNKTRKRKWKWFRW